LAVVLKYGSIWLTHFLPSPWAVQNPASPLSLLEFAGSEKVYPFPNYFAGLV